MASLQGQVEVALMDGGGRMSASDVARLRHITCKLIWSKRPDVAVCFMDKDCNMSEKFFKPAEDIVFITSYFLLELNT